MHFESLNLSSGDQVITILLRLRKQNLWKRLLWKLRVSSF
ncbi:hypothetical protein F383_31960 [Gossypium arboreum]|uniref:Uncharacterized protein n=1 Tax=Gossypium arboreum TaxID=29729 RepID=A0A0B0PP41_GOSAR|nr:hypothetical protein F383_31960 [Gossypium arboreum]